VRRTIATVAVASALIGAVSLLPTGAAASPAGTHCVNLTVTAALKTALLTAHRRNDHAGATGPRRGSVRYGRCTTTYYAIATFHDPVGGYTYQPAVLRRETGHRWLDLGDSAGNPCPFVPRALARIWKLRCAA
jgi:hypothetical protein